MTGMIHSLIFVVASKDYAGVWEITDSKSNPATPPGVPAVKFWWCYMELLYGGFWNGGTSKSSILIGFSIINHPAIGVPSFEENPI